MDSSENIKKYIQHLYKTIKTYYFENIELNYSYQILMTKDIIKDNILLFY